jgi:hypothetical protein
MLFSKIIAVRIAIEICAGIINLIPKSLLLILDRMKIKGNVEKKVRNQNLLSLLIKIFFLQIITKTIPINWIIPISMNR